MIGKLVTAAAVISSVATAGAIHGDAVVMAAAASSAPINISVNGGRFTGNGDFYPGGPNDPNHGGFHFRGNLDDTSNNGREIYLEVAVEGYGFNEFRNAVDTDRYWDQNVWDYQALYTNDARMRVCEAIDFWPDTCSGEVQFHR